MPTYKTQYAAPYYMRHGMSYMGQGICVREPGLFDSLLEMSQGT